MKNFIIQRWNENEIRDEKELIESKNEESGGKPVECSVLKSKGEKCFEEKGVIYLSHSLICSKWRLKADHWCIGPHGDHSLGLWRAVSVE